MAYRVNSIFRTIQGEGVNAGRAAIFVRFAGCNLWSGREEDRAGGCSAWCDTEFRSLSFKTTSAELLCDRIEEVWGGRPPLVVFTGGEPMIQIDRELDHAVIRRGWECWVETNGTIKVPEVWGVRKTVSPKAGSDWSVANAVEVKLAYPQAGLMPADFEAACLGELGALPHHLSLQPIWGPDLAANTAGAVAWCIDNPRWRLSLQTHKFAGID